jgi:hypothetical protein
LQHKALFLFATLLVLTYTPAVGYYLVDAQEDNEEGSHLNCYDSVVYYVIFYML